MLNNVCLSGDFESSASLLIHQNDFFPKRIFDAFSKLPSEYLKIYLFLYFYLIFLQGAQYVESNLHHLPSLTSVKYYKNCLSWLYWHISCPLSPPLFCSHTLSFKLPIGILFLSQ